VIGECRSRRLGDSGANQGLVVEAARRYIDRGFTFVAVGIDLLLLAKGAQFLRASFGEPA